MRTAEMGAIQRPSCIPVAMAGNDSERPAITGRLDDFVSGMQPQIERLFPWRTIVFPVKK